VALKGWKEVTVTLQIEDLDNTLEAAIASLETKRSTHGVARGAREVFIRLIRDLKGFRNDFSSMRRTRLEYPMVFGYSASAYPKSWSEKP
jgi:hypothetical protein